MGSTVSPTPTGVDASLLPSSVLDEEHVDSETVNPVNITPEDGSVNSDRPAEQSNAPEGVSRPFASQRAGEGEPVELVPIAEPVLKEALWRPRSYRR